MLSKPYIYYFEALKTDPSILQDSILKYQFEISKNTEDYKKDIDNFFTDLSTEKICNILAIFLYQRDTINRITDTNNALLSELSIKDTTVKTKQTELELLKSNNSSLSKQVSTLKSAKKALEDKFADLKSTSNSKISELSASLSSERLYLKTTSQKLKIAQNTIDELKKTHSDFLKNKRAFIRAHNLPDACPFTINLVSERIDPQVTLRDTKNILSTFNFTQTHNKGHSSSPEKSSQKKTLRRRSPGEASKKNLLGYGMSSPEASVSSSYLDFSATKKEKNSVQEKYKIPTPSSLGEGSNFLPYFLLHMEEENNLHRETVAEIRRRFRLVCSAVVSFFEEEWKSLLPEKGKSRVFKSHLVDFEEDLLRMRGGEAFESTLDRKLDKVKQEAEELKECFEARTDMFEKGLLSVVELAQTLLGKVSGFEKKDCGEKLREEIEEQVEKVRGFRSVYLYFVGYLRRLSEEALFE